ncbi:MAG: hypothetical protein QG635_606, partial [Bacteroidota bacterium]|nr:hypothetical protein [Bacteroidota bacterium]
SYDSIVIDYDTPLKKTRRERIEITCDSINKEGRLFLSQRLIKFMSAESKDTLKNIENPETSWLNRSVWYEIDSTGKRYSWGVDNPNIEAMSPGGAFQPNMIFSLGYGCKTVNQAWIVESTDDLPENGIPVPILRQMSFYRMYDKFDTLGQTCYKLEFIKTGQGSVWLDTKEDSIRITNIINGYGELALSVDKMIPVHYFGTVEQKLTIHLADGTEKPGWHYINTKYTLDEYIPAPSEINRTKQSPQQHLKKKKLSK